MCYLPVKLLQNAPKCRWERSMGELTALLQTVLLDKGESRRDRGEETGRERVEGELNERGGKERCNCGPTFHREILRTLLCINGLITVACFLLPLVTAGCLSIISVERNISIYVAFISTKSQHRDDLKLIRF